MRVLTTSDILELTDKLVLASTADVVHSGGLSVKEWKGWLKKGIVKPVAGGRGKGQHARFSTVQAVAIVMAV